MLENRWTRAGAFFGVTFAVPVLLGAAFGNLDFGIQIGTIMGIIFGVMSQFFEPNNHPGNS